MRVPWCYIFPSRQEKALETARKEVIPDKCGFFEKFLAANDKEGFFIADKVNDFLLERNRIDKNLDKIYNI